MKRSIIATIATIAVVAAGCSSSDPTTSDEYQALEQELALADQQLAETEQELADAEAQAVAISAERDAHWRRLLIRATATTTRRGARRRSGRSWTTQRRSEPKTRSQTCSQRMPKATL